jgi:hypothetical protein
LLDRVIDPELPQFRNTDGDEIAFVTLRFPLAPGVAAASVQHALNEVTVFHSGDNAFCWRWMDASHADSDAADGIEVMGSDRSAVLGNIELADGAVVFETNSERRGERGSMLMAAALGALVGIPTVDVRTVADMMAAKLDEVVEASSKIPADVERTIVHEQIHKHYKETLDLPVPMLGNVTPRAAARTPEGRAMLVDWLKFIENGSAKNDAASPMSGYDVSWLWQELGVADLRR